MAGGGWLLGQGAAGEQGDRGEAQATGANPTDRGKGGVKRHLLTDGQGVPLAVVLSGANRTEMKKLGDLLDALVYEAAPVEVPQHLCLDRGYDYAACRETATAHGYIPHIPPQASAASPLPPPGHPDRHPPRRWVVEVAHSWCTRFRRLLIRWEKHADLYLGFIQLAACLIVYRKLRQARSLSG